MITEKPVEGCRWKTVVCTDREAREYFLAKGLTYEGITEGDILALVLLLSEAAKPVWIRCTSAGKLTCSENRTAGSSAAISM